MIICKKGESDTDVSGHFLLRLSDSPNPIKPKPNKINKSTNQMLRKAIAIPTKTNIRITKVANNSIGMLIFFNDDTSSIVSSNILFT